MVTAPNVHCATQRNGRTRVMGDEAEEDVSGPGEAGAIITTLLLADGGVVGKREIDGAFVGDSVRGVTSQGSRICNRSTLLQFRTMADKSPEFRRVRPANLRNVGPVLSSSHCKQSAK